MPLLIPWCHFNVRCLYLYTCHTVGTVACLPPHLPPQFFCLLLSQLTPAAGPLLWLDIPAQHYTPCKFGSVLGTHIVLHYPFVAFIPTTLDCSFPLRCYYNLHRTDFQVDDYSHDFPPTPFANSPPCYLFLIPIQYLHTLPHYSPFTTIPTTLPYLQQHSTLPYLPVPSIPRSPHYTVLFCCSIDYSCYIPQFLPTLIYLQFLPTTTHLYCLDWNHYSAGHSELLWEDLPPTTAACHSL